MENRGKSWGKLSGKVMEFGNTFECSGKSWNFEMNFDIFGFGIMT